MAQHPDTSTHVARLVIEAMLEDAAFAGRERDEASQQAQQAGLASSVVTEDHQHLAGIELEVDASEDREASGENDCVGEVDGGGHAASNPTGRRSESSFGRRTSWRGAVGQEIWRVSCSMSDSTIIWTRVGKSTSRSQPRTVSALVGSPMSRSTSAGRRNRSSRTTWSS